MKHLNQYKNNSFDLKALPLYITEYIIKKKLEKPIDSEDHYDYFPETKEELIENIKECFNNEDYNLNCINTSKITDMSNLFKYIDLYNVNFDVSKWDVSNVENTSFMFTGFVKFNCDLSNWDVSKVTNMNYMFYNCENFDYDLSKWDVSNVLNMICMFGNCKNFKGIGLDNWNVSKVKHMQNMLNGCKSIIKKPKWYRFKIK